MLREARSEPLSAVQMDSILEVVVHTRLYASVCSAATQAQIETVAAKTIERFAERWTRLYEQGADAVRIRDYVRHWRRWVTGGLGARKLDMATRLETIESFGLLRSLSSMNRGCGGSGGPTSLPRTALTGNTRAVDLVNCLQHRRQSG